MRFEIDTYARTIILKSQHTIAEIESELHKILGEDYKNYTILTETVYVDRFYPLWVPTYYEQFKISDSPTFTITTGTVTCDSLFSTN